MMNFSFWFFLESARKYIRSRREASPKNPENTFIVLYGSDPEERELMFSQKERLKRLGLRYFGPNQTYSLFSTKLTPQIRAELEGMGVDLGGYDAPPQQTEDPQAPAEPSAADETLEKMHGELERVITNDRKAQSLVDSIERMIEEVANSTDEAAKQSFIRNFLDFAGRFYNYSLYNQILIWIQTKGQAQHVASAKKWEEFGRTVKDWGKSIDILAPRTPKKTKEDPAEERKARTPVYFVAVKVYDVSATVPIPGHPKSFEPVSRKDWSKDSNEDLKEIRELVSALDAWVKDQGIEVKPEDMEGEKGGYSAGGRIAINSTFRGINMFSTYVHEVAHELLHWRDVEGKMSTRQEKEIDAETTAYIVLRHFGLETKDTSNYLALWRAKGDDVRARRKNIHKAAMEIIKGVKEKMEPSPSEQDEGNSRA
jgi:hypothetical protein